MSFIDFEIRHDGTNIKDHVISYQRNQQICTGIGTIDIVLENKNLNRNITPWDTIILYEEGNKIGTYIVATVIESADGGTKTLQCQDYSKKLQDNYITENYNISYTTTTRYWIEFFLNESDVDYQFTVSGDGEIVAPNSNFGMSFAYDLIVSFLQQSGWYIYFDKNGDAIVGTLERAGDSYDDNLTDTEILTVSRMKNDNRLRNRAVVWGMGDPITGSWIGADISRTTPWNYDSHDKRAIVLSNSMIYSTAVAEDLARKMLNEFSKVANEIIVEVVGHHDIELGDMVHVNSEYFSGRMRVTTIESEGSANGLILRLTLNQMCPRLFAYFGYLSDYVPVYIGTWGQGVWKKYTGGTIWTQVSSGLLDQGLYIKDLFIKLGNLACVANDGYMYYSNIVTNIWTKFLHGDLTDLDGNSYLEEEIKATACSIDDVGNIIVGYNYLSEDQLTKRSWIVTVSGVGTLVKVEQIIVYNSQEIQLVDLEAVGYPEEGIIESIKLNSHGNLGTALLTRTTQAWATLYDSPAQYPYAPDKDAFISGPTGVTNLTEYMSGATSNRWTQIISNQTNHAYYIGSSTGYNFSIVDFDLTNWTVTKYPFTAPDVFLSEFAPDIRCGFLHQQAEGVFDLIWVKFVPLDDEYEIINTLRVYHYVITTAGSVTSVGNLNIISPNVNNISLWVEGLVCRDNIFVIAASYYNYAQTEGGESTAVYVYNITTRQWTSDSLIVDTRVNPTNQSRFMIGDVQHAKIIVTGNEIIVARYFPLFSDYEYVGPLFPFGENWQPTTLYIRVMAILINNWGGMLKYNQHPASLVHYQESPAGQYINGSLSINPEWWGSSGYGYENGYDLLHINYAFWDGWDYTYIDKLFAISVWWPYINGFDVALSAVKEVDLDPSMQWYDSSGVFKNAYYNFGNLGEAWTHPGHFHNASARFRNPVVHFDAWSEFDFINGFPTGELYIDIVDLCTLDSVSILREGITYAINDDRSRGPMDDINSTLFLTGSWTSYTGLLGLNTSGYPIQVVTESTPVSFSPTLWIAGNLFQYTSGGNVYVFKSTPAYNEFGSAILKHTTSGIPPTTSGIFEVILEPDDLTKVEISKGVPTIVYTPPWMSGTLNIPPLNYLAASTTNLANDFYFPPENQYPLYDVRVFDVPSSGFTVASGVLPDSLLERYIGIAASGEIVMINYGMVGDWYQLISMSGLLALASGIPYNPSGAITTLETTNYTLVPYIFVGLSGPPPLFFQRTIYPWWVNASYTLPSSDITCIRVDDDI